MHPTDALKEHLSTETEPSNARYLCFNTGGVEIEVGEFLYGLVRMLKPTRILETGTHKGISASYMGLALRDNGVGHLDTVEFLQPNAEDSTALFTKLNIQAFITLHLSDAAKFKPDTTTLFDIAFLDTEPQTRFAEFLQFFDAVKPGGFIFIHDLHPHMHQIPNEEHGFAWPYGKVPEAMITLIKEGKIKLVHFRTPRGLTMFYKVAPDDYKVESNA